MSRATERRALPLAEHFVEINRDLDAIYDRLDGHDEGFDAVENKINKILWALMGILLSTTTAAILLALNLAVGNAS